MPVLVPVEPDDRGGGAFVDRGEVRGVSGRQRAHLERFVDGTHHRSEDLSGQPPTVGAGPPRDPGEGVGDPTGVTEHHCGATLGCVPDEPRGTEVLRGAGLAGDGPADLRGPTGAVCDDPGEHR